MEKRVLDAMKKAGKPIRPGDIAKLIGEESKEVSKVISGLKKKGKVISPKRCYYSLGEE
ncbi:MAG: transcriptional regulator [Deltaproteobacteria bacterium]|nr:transcriptional regulator [Deltaproteobacteria bacterium]MBW1736957.1 transcriptional regulator [Deltaproteobacteria bacterium]MBW1910005.1 transcriptional regulator [Deltaproteobacteria bacterium]MBW2033284.1 transcriptional regulator [Deltaproteobacteria bacterium]MBW2114366.1 transcriptional regulator [Deltaproteobacteria bacterium]